MVNVHPDTTVCTQPCHSRKRSGLMVQVANDNTRRDEVSGAGSYCVVSLHKFDSVVVQ